MGSIVCFTELVHIRDLGALVLPRIKIDLTILIGFVRTPKRGVLDTVLTFSNAFDRCVIPELGRMFILPLFR